MTDPGFVLNLLRTGFSVTVAVILLSNLVTLHVFPRVVKASSSLQLLVLKLIFWFAYCLVCRLQPGLRWVPGLASKAEKCVCRHLWDCVPLFVQAQRAADVHCPYFTEISRFVSLLGLLIVHPRWWVRNNCSINQCTFILKVTGLNFLSTLSCQECKFRWSRSTQKTQRVWWLGGCPPSRSAVCGWQEGHRQ